jgi:MOSC domain-containing protein YiiM
MKGSIEHIHIADEAGGPVRPLAEVQVHAGIGIEGDRYAQRKGSWQNGNVGRDLTLIEAEAIEDVVKDGIVLAPGESRRNITTRGIRLNDLVGKEFRIGDVRARGTKLCEPCSHLEALTGKPLIKPLTHRAGLRADLLTSGRISVGDPIEVEQPFKRP